MYLLQTYYLTHFCLFIHLAMLFSGKDNSIYMTREYFQEYSCAFDLKYYPFDTQVNYFAIIQTISKLKQ